MRFSAALATIEGREPGAIGRLEGYARLYVDVLATGRMCLCGMLAAEHSTLPEPMQRAIRTFFDANEAWLVRVLESGRDAREVSFPGSARDAARLWTSALEGAMLLAKTYGEPARLSSAIRRMVADLSPRSAAPRARATRRV
jgi:TetR/AcrR family transcriptional repressor of nem operon